MRTHRHIRLSLMTSTLLFVLVGLAGWAGLPPVQAAGDQDYMPLRAGATWTYVTTHGTRTDRARIVVKSAQNGHFVLDWNGTEATGKLTAQGFTLQTVRHVGYTGVARVMPINELRWAGASAWEFTTADGCFIEKIQCRRLGMESVETPTGRFDCLKIVNDDMAGADTFWLARGVGIVRRVFGGGPAPFTWTLSQHS